MNNLKDSKKKLKNYITDEKRRTLVLIGALLVLGTTCFKEEVLAIDLRNRNVINIEGSDTVLRTSADGVDVIHISTPDSKGISHNKFIDLSVGSGNGVIFNNSTEHGQSEIGGYVLKNPNLKQSAAVILNEVTGATPSNISGYIEVFGDKADFILANENGIVLNNAKFINTKGVTLTTGKVEVDRSKFEFDIQKGEVILNGVESAGDYFGVFAKAIEVQQKLSSGEKEKDFDINMVAGEKILHGDVNNIGKTEVVASQRAQSEKHGIYITSLGAMYGNNIRLISKSSALGVRHDGLIFSTDDVKINSNGEIVLKGKIASEKDVSIETNGDIINNGTILGSRNIDIYGKNIINNDRANIWTTKSESGDINISGKNIINNSGVNILATKNLNLTAEEKISNKAGSRVDSKEEMTMTARKIEN